MILKQVRLSQQDKDMLIRLKAKTGIQNWNVLCRWALCLSLSHPAIPAEYDLVADSNVEMSWHVFAGEYHEIYDSMVIQRCILDGLPTDPATVARQFRLHLHRGIVYLSSPGRIKSLSDLLRLGLLTSSLRDAKGGDSSWEPT